MGTESASESAKERKSAKDLIGFEGMITSPYFEGIFPENQIKVSVALEPKRTLIELGQELPADFSDHVLLLAYQTNGDEKWTRTSYAEIADREKMEGEYNLQLLSVNIPDKNDAGKILDTGTFVLQIEIKEGGEFHFKLILALQKAKKVIPCPAEIKLEPIREG